MTKTEYLTAKKRNNSATASTVRNSLIKVRRMYAKVLKRMNRVIARLPQTELSSRSRERILASVPRDKLFTGITALIDTGRKKVIKRTFDIDRKYVEDAFREAGRPIDLEAVFDRQAGKIDKLYQIKNYSPYHSVKNSFLVYNRAKYGLSPKIWASIDDFSDKILTIVEADLKAGIDPVETAKRLEMYIKESEGYLKVQGKWGKLHVGKADYIHRLGKGGADYRSQRVVRTEMYTARRDADIEAGRMNPGATDMFNWMLGPTSDDVCDICSGWASGGPYTAEQIQSMQDESHPNCFCLVQPVLKDREEFMAELKAYIDGDDNAIADWASLYGVV